MLFALKMNQKHISCWRIAYYFLLVCWILGALLFMYRIRAGWLNCYLSDVAFPPWFYIHLRGLHRSDRRKAFLPIVKDFFGVIPWRAGISIFLVGLVSELLVVWPRPLITGTFDPLDILAYAVGLIVCMAFDLWKKAG